MPRTEKKADTPVPGSSDPKELVLHRLKEVEERVQQGIEERVQQAIEEVTGVFERRIRELERELSEKEAELLRVRQREHDNDIRRNVQIDERMDALTRRDQELAERMAKIAAPQLEASGAVGAKAVVDASEKHSKRRDLIRDVVFGLVLAIVLLYQALGGKELFKDPPPPLPTPTPAPGPGYGGRP